LPIIGCCCPACGDLSLQRQRVKRLIMELEREHPNVKASMLKALGNVMPRHLLDRRLNPARDAAQDASHALDLLGDLAPETPIVPLLTARHAR
jgi:tRNA(Ile)-lysidine synthase TilS/MesJ